MEIRTAVYYVEWNGNVSTGKIFVEEAQTNGLTSKGWHYTDSNGKMYNEKEREILIQQVMYFLETNFGKPLKWIKENDMCALFREIDNDG